MTGGLDDPRWTSCLPQRGLQGAAAREEAQRLDEYRLRHRIGGREVVMAGTLVRRGWTVQRYESAIGVVVDWALAQRTAAARLSITEGGDEAAARVDLTIQAGVVIDEMAGRSTASSLTALRWLGLLFGSSHFWDVNELRWNAPAVLRGYANASSRHGALTPAIWAAGLSWVEVEERQRIGDLDMAGLMLLAGLRGYQFPPVWFDTPES